MAGSEDECPVGEASPSEQLFIDDKSSDDDLCKDVDATGEPASNLRSSTGEDSKNSLDVDLYADMCPTSEGESSLGLLPFLGNDDKSTDLDLYTDLLAAESEQQQTDKAEAKEKLGEQAKLLEQLKSANTHLENQNKHLLRNISVLFTTAKHEVTRKDKQIRELQERLDSIVFRRANRFDSPNSTHNDEDKTVQNGHMTRDRNNAPLRGSDYHDASSFRTPASPTTINGLSFSSRTPPQSHYAISSPEPLPHKSMYRNHVCSITRRTDRVAAARKRRRELEDYSAENLCPSSLRRACTLPEIGCEKKRKVHKLRDRKKEKMRIKKTVSKTAEDKCGSDKRSKVENGDCAMLLNYLEIKKPARNKSKKVKAEDLAESAIDCSSSMHSTRQSRENSVKDSSPIDVANGDKDASCELNMAVDKTGFPIQQVGSESSTENGLVIATEDSALSNGNVADEGKPVDAVQQVETKQEMRGSPVKSADCASQSPVKSEQNESSKGKLAEKFDHKVISLHQKSLSSIILSPKSVGNHSNKNKIRTQDKKKTLSISANRTKHSTKIGHKKERSPPTARNVGSNLHMKANNHGSKLNNLKQTFRYHKKVHSDTLALKNKISRADERRKPKKETIVPNASEAKNDSSVTRKKVDHRSPSVTREKRRKNWVNDGREESKGVMSGSSKSLSDKQTKKYRHVKGMLNDNKHANDDKKNHHHHYQKRIQSTQNDDKHVRPGKHIDSRNAISDNRKKSDSKNRTRKNNDSFYDNRKKDDNTSKDAQKKDVHAISDRQTKPEVKRKVSDDCKKSDGKLVSEDSKRGMDATLLKDKCKKNSDAITVSRKKWEIKNSESDISKNVADCVKSKISHSHKQKNDNTAIAASTMKNGNVIHDTASDTAFCDILKKCDINMTSNGVNDAVQHQEDDKSTLEIKAHCGVKDLPKSEFRNPKDETNVPKLEKSGTIIFTLCNTLVVNKDETKELTGGSAEPPVPSEDVEDGEIVSEESDDEKPQRFNKLENSRTPIKSVITSPGFKRRIGSTGVRRPTFREDDRVLEANRKKMELRRQSVLIEKAKEMARRRLDHHKKGESSFPRKYPHFERSVRSRVVYSKRKLRDRQTSSHSSRK